MSSDLSIPIVLLTISLRVHSSWRREPKQDHLVCFLAGSLLLGAVSTRDGGTGEWASVPPTEEELNAGDGRAVRDWTTGLDLLDTCLETHKSETYASTPRIVTLDAVLTCDDKQGPRS
jgi:hypothetical protein